MKAFTELGTIAKILWRWICGLIKVAWTLAALIIVGLTATFVILIFVDTEISHTVSNRYYVYKHNMIDRYYIYDSRSGKKTVKWISSIDKKFGEDSLIRFSRKNFWGKNERFGYIDACTGKVAIEPQYYYAGEFSEGLAAARGENGIGFIDTTGKIVVPVKGTIMNRSSLKMCNGYAIVNVGIGRDNRYGILSSKGEWVLEPIYDEIERCTQNCYLVSTEFWMGLWSVEKGWIVEPNCIEIDSCNDGFYVLGSDKAYIIDADGNIINPFVFSYSEPLSYPISGDDKTTRRISDYVLFAIADKCYGVYNIRTNKVILPAKYTSIYMASKDIFVVENGPGIENFVDKNGNVISPENVK